MKFSNPESKKALEFAQAREQEAVKLYQTCKDNAKNPGTVEISGILIKEEQKHFDIVTKMLNEANDVSSIKISETGKPKELLEKMFSHKKMDDFKSESSTVMDLLTQALKNEKESFDLYTKAQKDSVDNETAAVFKYLAAEENKHYIMIDNLRDYLDKPDKWIYEEENQLFQL